MRCLADVNVLVAGFYDGHEHHEIARRALSDIYARGDTLALTSVAVSGLLRVMAGGAYRHRLHALAEPVAFVNDLLASSQTEHVEPSARHWLLFQSHVRTGRIGRRAMTDAWFAALAVEAKATLVSFDGAFANYPGLKFRHLTA